MIVRVLKRVGREAAYLGFRIACRFLPSPTFDPARVRKILIPLYMGIGNVVLYTPALRAIRRQFPDAEIVIAVGNSRSNDEVLGPDLVDRVVRLPLDAPFGDKRRACERLRDERFDLSINSFLCFQPYHALFTAYARIPWRCGHVSSPGWRGSFDFLYNIPVVMKKDQHEVDRYLELAAALGIDRDSVDPHPSFRVTDEARTEAQELLATRGMPEAARFIAVHAGTSEVMRWKQWGLDRFERVAIELAALYPSVTFVLVGAPDEKAEQLGLIGRLSTALGQRFVDLVGETTIPVLGAVLSRAELLIGNDSGPMQIAAALDVPTVVPWGPSDLPRNRPLGALHTVVFKRLPCAPCYRMPGDSKVHLCEHRLCLDSIQVDEIISAAVLRLETLGIHKNG